MPPGQTRHQESPAAPASGHRKHRERPGARPGAGAAGPPALPGPGSSRAHPPPRGPPQSLPDHQPPPTISRFDRSTGDRRNPRARADPTGCGNGPGPGARVRPAPHPNDAAIPPGPNKRPVDPVPPHPPPTPARPAGSSGHCGWPQRGWGPPRCGRKPPTTHPPTRHQAFPWLAAAMPAAAAAAPHPSGQTDRCRGRKGGPIRGRAVPSPAARELKNGAAAKGLGAGPDSAGPQTAGSVPPDRSPPLWCGGPSLQAGRGQPPEPEIRARNGPAHPAPIGPPGPGPMESPAAA